MAKSLCIYHGNCADGFGAAWVVRKALGEAHCDFHAGVYQDPPPDVTDRDVYIVDFSYKLPVMEKLVERSRHLTIIDHHKSAIEELGAPLQRMQDEVVGDLDFVFDLDHSGAMLTWKYFFPDEAPPGLIEHIQDRDLWRFVLPHTREIQAAVFSYPYDFAVWDRLMDGDVQALAAEGAAIDRKLLKDVEELIKVCTTWRRIAGELVPCASIPYTYTSEAGHLLCEVHGTPFAACYWDTPAGRVFSLRSLDSGADVSAVAKQFGGGGHARAAGFRVPWDHLLCQPPRDESPRWS